MTTPQNSPYGPPPLPAEMHMGPPGDGPRPGPRRRGYVLTYLGGLLTGLAVAGAAVLVTQLPPRGGHTVAEGLTPTPSPSGVTMQGEVTMDQYDGPSSSFTDANWASLGNGGCEGKGGYDDMTEGVTVTAYNAAGDVIGLGALEQGTRVGRQCVWKFTVSNLPASNFFQVEVSHRGKVTVQPADVGSVSLSLG